MPPSQNSAIKTPNYIMAPKGFKDPLTAKWRWSIESLDHGVLDTSDGTHRGEFGVATKDKVH